MAAVTEIAAPATGQTVRHRSVLLEWYDFAIYGVD